MTGQNLSNLVETELLELGITPDYRGYRYLVTAIQMAMQDEEIIYNVTTKLYVAIAEIYHTTGANVERSIRTAISVLWSQSDPADLARLLGKTYTQPLGNAKFIGVVSRKLLLRMGRPPAGSRENAGQTGKPGKGVTC